jgi:hypothetical protein
MPWVGMPKETIGELEKGTSQDEPPNLQNSEGGKVRG